MEPEVITTTEVDEEALTEAAAHYPHLARAVYETPWAIQPAKLDEILAFMATKLRGDDVPPDDVEAISAAARRPGPYRMSGSIAVLPIVGTIIPRAGGLSAMSGATSIQRFRASFRAALEDDRVSAIVLDVDSPGGMVDGVPELADEIYAARGKKPIIAQANTFIASAAYWLASQADELVVSRSSEVGSIGVVMMHSNWGEHYAKAGVEITYVATPRYKTEGNPHESLSEETRAHLQSQINTYYGMFVNAVARGRGVAVATVREEFGEGRMVLANDAVRRGMADRVATMRQTIGRLSGRPHRSLDLDGINAAEDAPDTPMLLESADDDDIAGILSDGQLLESADNGEGWRWRVQIIEAGVSRNRTEYPLDVLHARAGLYEGVPVFYGAGRDHNPNERGFASVAGYIRDPKPNATGVEGTFEINHGKPELRASILQAWEVYQRTGKAPFGFSHAVPLGAYATSIVRRASGYIKRITDFTQVDSVDLVMRPSAGGRLIGLMAAADSGETERELVAMEHDELLARLRSGETLTAEERETLRAADLVAYEDAFLEGALARREPAVATLEVTPLEAVTELAEATLDTSVFDNQIAQMTDLMTQVRVERAENVLNQRLSASRLPEPLIESIREDFTGQVFEVDALDQRIERERGIHARLYESFGAGMPFAGGATIEITADQVDKHQAAMDGMFGLIRGEVPREDTIDIMWHQTPSHFGNLDEAYRAITGRQVRPENMLAEAMSYVPETVDGHLRESINTSTFAQILGDSIRRRMIAEYSQDDLQSFNQLVSEVTNLRDFRTNRRVRMGGYGELPTVGEGGVYQPMTSPGDEEATYVPSKKGGTEDLTMEMVLNDDMMRVRAIPVKLGQSAVRTLRHAIYNDVLRDNLVVYDSVALFHNDHGNLGSTALSGAGMTATRAAMRAQMPYGITDQPLGAANIPRRLFVPSELEEIAFKIANSMPYVLATNENATTPNLHRGLQYTVVDEWTDATDWVAAANPANVPIIELGYLNGRQEPELFVQDAATVGSVFTADKITFKIRHIWGYVVLDFRGLFKHVVGG